jgi:peptidoglycan/xylan/chitin deacetylase (PgdA/CDA1 family)
MNRRDFVKNSTVSAIALGAVSSPLFSTAREKEFSSMKSTTVHSTESAWPDGARLVISISMQMEAGAQPASGAESPMPPIDPKYPDLPATKWYEYGFKEGLPRLLDMFDRRQVKVTSHMVGAAVDQHPELAKEIVQRGHEASGHGQAWTAEYSMTPDEERTAYLQSIQSIERATGTRPFGFNAFWLRGTPRTLEILQELGFIYHIDDISRDEPFLIDVKGKPFAVVPYTLHMNDIVNYEMRYFSTNEYAADLKNEFDQLYDEAATRRRMMSVSAHDRIAGRPSRAKVLEDFIRYAQQHQSVVFMRKLEIARFALESPAVIREERKAQPHAAA